MVSLNKPYTVRLFERRDLTPMRNLTFYSYRVHTHLDWQTVYEYLQNHEGMLWVVYADKRLIGAIGLSEPINNIAWVRLLAIDDDTDPQTMLHILWETAKNHAKTIHIEQIALLLIRDWLHDWKQALNLQYVEQIITLSYDQPTPPAPPKTAPLAIQSAELYDLPTLHTIDDAAFSDPWRMTQREMRLGMRISAYTARAQINNQIVGYQIATTHGSHGHLARLGVHPSVQGKGVGSALLHNMIVFFHERRINSLTVNTQESNIRSQRLYERFGFERNGYDLSVWVAPI